MSSVPNLQSILKAYKRIKPFIHQTPVMTSLALNKFTQSKLFFKCENFQKSGSFKYRGATNAILSIPKSKRHIPVGTHSSGNHGQALALAALTHKRKAFIVMPNDSNPKKVAATKEYKSTVVFSEPDDKSRASTLEELRKKHKLEIIHPYNDYRVIAGQGTTALELFQQVKKLDCIICPISGGGLISGILLATKELSPKTKVYGAEPELAKDAYLSLKSGKMEPQLPPKTIADGLRAGLGDKTFAIIKKHISDIITVEEHEIVEAMQMIWERMKILVEPSSAIVYGALLKRKQLFKNKKVGLILSGGNVDVNDLPFRQKK